MSERNLADFINANVDDRGYIDFATSRRLSCASCRHMWRVPQMTREGKREWQHAEEQWCTRYPEWLKVGSHLMSTKPRPAGPNHWCGEHAPSPLAAERKSEGEP